MMLEIDWRDLQSSKALRPETFQTTNSGVAQCSKSFVKDHLSYYISKMARSNIHQIICLAYLFASQVVNAINSRSSPSVFNHHASFQRQTSCISSSQTMNLLSNLRGGDTDENDNDEERYSRQFYTLGARAHSLVRTSTILVDGPARSGLVYESVKNLALSGVGKIILLTNDGETSQGQLEDNYFNHDMDDLGTVYRRGAKAECFPNASEDDEVDDVELMVEYVRRLNPSVKIEVMKRSEFLSGISQDDVASEMDQILGTNPVLLCVDRPLSTQRLLNDACRNLSTSIHEKSCIPFVSVETAGVYGKAFCDFGDEFHVVDEDGETPKATLLENVEKSEGNDSGEIIVHCVEGERHDVSKGDRIDFQWKNGDQDAMNNKECVVVYIKNPTYFRAKFCSKDEGSEETEADELDDLIETINTGANAFVRVKVPQAMSFLSLKEALAAQNDARKEVFAASDLDKSFDLIRRKAVMSSFAALESVVEKRSSLPSHDEIDEFVSTAGNTSGEEGKHFKAIASSFAKCAKAKFTPLQAIYGALGAQEALKAASGLYNPIKQFLLYDCDEILIGVKSKAEDGDSHVSGMKYILGKKLLKKLASQKVFVVGSGAIGCEILKNLAAMDVGTRKSKGGSIILTDMDTIEKSNLSRQLLFRDADVGKFKSVAAQEAMQRLNPKVKMDTHTSKVGDDATGTYFDDKFWSDGVDVVLNALDNVEARLFIDSQCVANQKALVDAGTLGSKGNVQVVVPRQSESYASSSDPPEPSIPVCTLKHFPYEISHTIQWGRDLFDGLFNRRPSQVNEQKESLSTMSPSDFARTLFDKLGEDAAMEMAAELATDCFDFDHEDDDYAMNIKRASLEWASDLSRNLFYNSVNALLKQHPLDSLDDDDKPFWSGTRKAPTPLSYSEENESPEQEKINQNIIDFVRYAARLRIEAYYSEKLLNDEETMIYSSASVEEAKQVLQKQTEEESTDSDDEASFQTRITAKVKDAKVTSSNIKDDLKVASFEKDDDSNGHVAFVTAASNLRAITYGITPVDAMETRRVAGRIVPAMITTTAFVSALSCIELVKLTQEAQLQLHRNAFVNLALPFFAFTSPLPAEEVSGLHGASHTIWDTIVVKEGEKSHAKGGITLRRLLLQIKKKSSKGDEEVEVTNISFGPYMLYANFLHEDDDHLLDTPMLQLVIDAISSGDIEDEDLGEEEEGDTPTSYTEAQLLEIEALKRRAFTDFTVLVEDTETGEEAELPPVRLLWWKED